MHDYPRSTTWPYVVLVVGLFYAAVKSPRLDHNFSLPALLSATFERTPHETLAPSASQDDPQTADSLTGRAIEEEPWTGDSLIRRASEEESPSHSPSRDDPHRRDPPETSSLAGPATIARAGEDDPPETTSTPGEVTRPATKIERPSTAQQQSALPATPARPEASASGDTAPTDASAVPADASPEKTKPSGLSPRPGRPTGQNWLVENLQRLGRQPLLDDWANLVEPLVQRLLDRPTLDDPAAAEALRRLSELVSAAAELDEQLGTDPERLQLRQLAYGLRRRILIWSQIATLDGLPRQQPATTSQLDLAARAAIQELSGDSRLDPWRDFLGLSTYQEIRLEPLEQQPSGVQQLAESLSRRQFDRRLSLDQRAFLERPVVANWLSTLASWRDTPRATLEFRELLEQFESAPTADHGRQWLASLWTVRSAFGAQADGLNQIVEEHYRNANVRLSISTDLINSVLPTLEGQAELVRDVILGAEVRGQNVSWTRLRVDPIVDDHRWHLVLRATGETLSTTASTKGPVTLYSRGNGLFEVEKHLLASPTGISVTQAQGTADSVSQLLSLRTQFDDVPLVGWMMRRYALQQHDEQRQEVRREVRQRIAMRAEHRLDREIQTRMDEFQHRWSDLVVDPLRDVQLEPRLIELSTTADRLVLRGRLASPLQPAAFTARPQAREGSVLSFQMHQSTWNNLADQLCLDGQELSLDEVVQRLTKRLRWYPRRGELDLPSGVRIRFAPHDAITCRFADGRVVVTVHIAELDNGPRRWRDFTVRGYYRTDVEGLTVELVRDGQIELIADSLGFRDRVALRGIFTKVLTNNHRVQLLRQMIDNAPHLKQLVVSQLHIDHGWIGLSFSLPPTQGVVTQSTPLLR